MMAPPHGAQLMVSPSPSPTPFPLCMLLDRTHTSLEEGRGGAISFSRQECVARRDDAAPWWGRCCMRVCGGVTE